MRSTVFGPRVKDNHEELRGLINAGYRRARYPDVASCVASRSRSRKSRLRGVVVIAGLGKLPDSIMSRSVIVPMRPRLLSCRPRTLRL